MAEYQAIYKCRLCGKEYVAKIIAGSEMLITDETEFCSAKMHRVHICDDGSFGLADFQGFRKVG